ncbi:MAG: lipopolysaccharide biosynthesis protein [Methylobacteriaceae bacterium]|nr:lipopolysaccharide biosynthesis protein [Methylobacteriaceae bacterium]
MRVLGAFLFNTLCNFGIGLIVAKFLGPAEYGRFALTLAIALTIQIALLDWTRLCAVRFYSERVRAAEPTIRATLDMAFALISFGIAGIAVIVAFLDGGRDPTRGLIGLALGVSIANSLFDYRTALVRARFHDRLYGRLVIIKNVFSLVLTGGAAFLFESAAMALIGGIVSLTGSVLTASAALSDAGAETSQARLSTARLLLGYSLPIITANLLYTAIPLANRALMTHLHGFAETGQFSLAYDLGLRAVLALGSAMDVLLFQMAVRAHETHGLDRAKAQIARNMTMVIAVLVPACAGIWATLPSIEQLIVPSQYREPFAHYMALLLPGLCATGMIHFAVNPMFQIGKNTAPLIGAALVGCVMNGLLIVVLARGGDASGLAIAQSGAAIASLIALLVFAARTQPHWPAARDLAAIAIGTGAMILVLLPLRNGPPGVLTLAAEIVVGMGVFAGLMLAFDGIGSRQLILGRFFAKPTEVQ